MHNLIMKKRSGDSVISFYSPDDNLTVHVQLRTNDTYYCTIVGDMEWHNTIVNPPERLVHPIDSDKAMREAASAALSFYFDALERNPYI